MASESFTPPAANIGEPVLWYADPMSPRDPVIGWICEQPGTHTCGLLVFSPIIGFQDKPSVRHKNDPSLKENPKWRQWGCWEHIPWFVKMQKLSSSMASAISASEKSSKRGTT